MRNRGKFTSNINLPAALAKLGMIPVEFEFQSYKKSNQYVESNCLGIIFTNDGNVMARINNRPLAPGQALPFGLDYPYFDVTKYKLTFDTPGPGGERLVWVTRILRSIAS